MKAAAECKAGKVAEDRGPALQSEYPMCQGKVVLCGDAALMVVSA